MHRPAKLITLSAGIVVVAGGGVAAALADNARGPRAEVSTSAEAAARALVDHATPTPTGTPRAAPQKTLAPDLAPQPQLPDAPGHPAAAAPAPRVALGVPKSLPALWHAPKAVAKAVVQPAVTVAEKAGSQTLAPPTAAAALPVAPPDPAALPPQASVAPHHSIPQVAPRTRSVPVPVPATTRFAPAPAPAPARRAADPGRFAGHDAAGHDSRGGGFSQRPHR